MKQDMNRRDFMKAAAIAALGAAWAPRQAFSETAGMENIFVVHGKNIAAMLAAGMSEMGGWGAFVKPGAKVVLKANAAWASLPEQGGNTTPELVAQATRSCLAEQAKQVVFPENPCSKADKAFSMSGIEKAMKSAGGVLYEPKARDFRPVSIPGGKVLKQANVVGDVLDCDCLINMPVAKNHGGAGLTITMKNWMGSVEDRGFWHRNDLHQCIADFSAFIKPSLLIVDATRIMVTRGPRGPGDLEYPEQIVFGLDPVAVDAYAATLFKKKPFDPPYIRMAHDMGIGCGDLANVNIKHIHV